RLASVAWLRRVASTAGAVERLGEQPRRGRLARAPAAAEQVRVRDPTRDDRALQRSRGGVLTHEVGERLRAVLAVEGLVLRHSIQSGRAPPSRDLAHSTGPRAPPRGVRKEAPRPLNATTRPAGDTLGHPAGSRKKHRARLTRPPAVQGTP